MRWPENSLNQEKSSCVMIRHKVANYAKWKHGVCAFSKFRKASGENVFTAASAARIPTTCWFGVIEIPRHEPRSSPSWRNCGTQ